MLPRRPITSISGPEWRMLLTVFPVVGLVRLGLSAMPFRTLVQQLRELASRLNSSRPADQRYVWRAAWAVNAVGRRVLGSRPCLTQALTLQFLLWRRGIDTELRIGVDKDEQGELLAHAWVVRDDQVLIGGHLSEAKYQVLPKLQEKIATQKAD